MLANRDIMPFDDAQDTIWEGLEVSSTSEECESIIEEIQEVHRIVRDGSYYFIEVTFLLEDTLFRVPRHYFERESEVFRDMFLLPVAEDTIPDGSSDEQPLRLDGILKEDFRQLLRVILPTDILVKEWLSLVEWTSVLKLSVMWQMDRVRDIAVESMSAVTAGVEEWMAVLDLSIPQQLSEARELAMQRLSDHCDITGVTKIVLARRYQVVRWMREGCRELVERQACFSDEEDEQLGLQTVLKLYRIRDGWLRNINSSRERELNRYRYLTGDPDDERDSYPVKANIEKEFKVELMEMELE